MDLFFLAWIRLELIMKSKPNVFYFIPQTGSITYGRMWSNYYQYALPASKLAKVKLELDQAVLTSSGFIYSKDFLNWLEEVEVKNG